MRTSSVAALILLALVLLISGAVLTMMRDEGSYELLGSAATVVFHSPWDAHNAATALEAAGYTIVSSGSNEVVGTRDHEEAIAREVPALQEDWQLQVRFYVENPETVSGEHRKSVEAAHQREVESQLLERLEDIERELGVEHVGRVHWSSIARME